MFVSLTINSLEENQNGPKNGAKVWHLRFSWAVDWGFFGWEWSVNRNSILGMDIGALTGVALGLFIASAVLEKEKEKEKKRR